MSRRRRQAVVRGTMYAGLVVGVLVLAAIADVESLQRQFLNLEIARDMFPEVLIIAARNTVLYTTLAFAFGLLVGLLLALMRLSSVGPYRWIAAVYIEIFRGLPALLTIFLVGFGIPLAFGTR
ncbi:MAG: ABC transporter permease subunit, partial [Ilumatobacteraceae bacterium]